MELVCLLEILFVKPLDLVAAERNLGQFFVLGECWFLVHVSLLKLRNRPHLAVTRLPLTKSITCFWCIPNSPWFVKLWCGSEVHLCMACLPEALVNSITILPFSPICTFLWDDWIHFQKPYSFSSCCRFPYRVTRWPPFIWQKRLNGG